jgi:hypothetical protein
LTRSHARFESLEGAILLGEASDAERQEFALHASACPLCGDVPLPGALTTAVATARDGESWRPSVDRPVLTRIRDERMKRSQFAVGALGWAAAFSIAINVAFVTGFAGRLAGAFDVDSAPPSVAATPFGVRLPPETFVTIKRRLLRPSETPVVARHEVRPKRPATLAAALHTSPRAIVPGTGPAPDVFAGLQLRGSGVERSVAVETQLTP